MFLSNAWYLDDLNYAIANGYISGTGDNTFSPDAGLSRGQFVTILGRMLGASVTNGSTKFTDVPTTSYYAPYVGWAAQNGYVSGTSDTTFAPDSVLTVEQMGTILANYISKTGAALTGYTPSAEYKDASSISQWAESSMETMRQYGMLVTDASGKVNPTSQVTRANGAVSLVRLARGMGLGDEPTIIQPPTPQTPTQQTGKVTYGSLIKGDPQLILWHEPDDMASIDNNIRYMLKNGLTSIQLDIDVQFGDMYVDFEAGIIDWGDPYKNNYIEVLRHYLDFGYGTTPSFTTSLSGGASTVISLFGDFSYATDEVDAQRNAALESAVKVRDELYASGALKSTMTQKEKARVYYDWILSHCEYDDRTANSLVAQYRNNAAFTPYGAFSSGKVVCEGYTAAYNLFLRLEGIDCATASTLNHVWTTATLDGVLYHIDTTWGDDGANANKYFCMTPEASWAIHK